MRLFLAIFALVFVLVMCGLLTYGIFVALPERQSLCRSHGMRYYQVREGWACVDADGRMYHFYD